MKRAVLTASLLLFPAATAYAEMNVVTTIKPVHSLVSGVMAGVGEPSLLIDGATSPHDFALKPSHMQMLQDSSVVFWVGEGLEAFMEKPLDTLSGKTYDVELLETPNLVTFEYRSIEEIGADDDHDHGHGHDHAEHKHGDDHGHDHAEHKHGDDHGHDHAEHKHGDDHGHDHAEHKDDGHGHGHGHDHAHGGTDSHIWLDPHNAKAMVAYIAEELAEKDPANAETYKSNAAAMTSRLEELDGSLKSKTSKLGDANYIVFHDAYQYFEKRYGLEPVGAITISPEVSPGARNIRELAEKVESMGKVCVFSEPQFPTKLVDTIAEGNDVKAGIIDPLGAKLAAGPDLYFDLMTNLADSLNNCLGETS